MPHDGLVWAMLVFKPCRTIHTVILLLGLQRGLYDYSYAEHEYHGIA